MTKGNLFGKNEWGQEQSSWDFLADKAVGVDHAVSGLAGEYLGSDVGGALGTAAGIGTSIVGSVPAAIGGLVDGASSAVGSAASWIGDLF